MVLSPYDLFLTTKTAIFNGSLRILLKPTSIQFFLSVSVSSSFAEVNQNIASMIEATLKLYNLRSPKAQIPKIKHD